MENVGKSRRIFLRAGLLGGAAGLAVEAQTTGSGGTAAGDHAILRFIALNEMLAADLTSQLAGQVRFNPGLGSVLQSLDPLLQNVLLQIAADEQSHAQFMAAYLPVTGAAGIDVRSFAILPNFGGPLASFTAAGAPGTVSGTGGAAGTGGTGGTTGGGTTGTGGTTGSAGTGGGSASGVTNPATGLPDAPGDNYVVLSSGRVGGGPIGIFGAGTTGRLTNLTQLRLNATFFNQIRSSSSTEFGAAFSPFLQSQTPVSAIPTAAAVGQSGLAPGAPGASTEATSAQSTAFNVLMLLAQMELAEATLYASFAPKLTSPDAVSVAASLSPVEAMHYTAIQMALARIAGGTAAARGVPGGGAGGSGAGTGGAGGGTGGDGTGGGGTGTGGTGSTGGTGGTGSAAPANPFGGGAVFAASIPGVNALSQNAAQAQLIFPIAFRFMQQLPFVALLRSHGLQNAAQAHARLIVESGLLMGQSQEFMNMLMEAATAADQAVRACR
ncbi:MAG TPA: hypothetical protein VFL57_05955 [Bryobacteraceae bacterium]|nr:hypothetical protein [Bryobacteraceae bacterium]